MPRCLDCANFDLKTHYCNWCNSYIRENSAKRSMPCDGFQRRKKNSRDVKRILEKHVERHHRVPDFKLVRCT